MSNICTCQQPQFFIPRSAFPFDERAAYTDSVLKVLLESRFGFGIDYRPYAQWNNRPELEPAAFCDLTGAYLVPWYLYTPLGRKAYQAMLSALQSAKQMGFPNARMHRTDSSASLTQNLGRGSPWSVGTNVLLSVALQRRVTHQAARSLKINPGTRGQRNSGVAARFDSRPTEKHSFSARRNDL